MTKTKSYLKNLLTLGIMKIHMRNPMSVTVSKKTSVMLIILMIVIPTGKLIYLTKRTPGRANPSRKALFSLVPYPAEEDNDDYPLPPCVGYVDLTGV